ncbi:MAG TPA: class I SAM-dependent methyltransferase, partial [Chloroflexota bacterium]|nr:class I SAM-dependent methyltransferase [Chloroflexota bacterium]
MEALCSPGRLLDIGPGAGAFLLHALARGWEVSGVEVQPEIAAAAERRTGAKVHAGEIGDQEIQTERFDAVTMWDVIEHVSSVRATLAAAASIVRPGGLLALSTIHAGSLNARVFGAHWAFWNRPGHVPEHLQGFRRQTLEMAARGAGFEPRVIRTQFIPGAVIEPLSRVMDIRPDRRPRPA